MALRFSLFNPPPVSSKPTTPFLHGSSPSLSLLTRPSPLSLSSAPSPALLPIRAMKLMQGRVVCATSDKTVSVEVTRMAPHPKYKRRVRKKKKYQAHDPENVFKVGDLVQLEKCRPISKTKSFLAVPPAPRNTASRDAAAAAAAAAADLGLPLESAQ